MGQREPVTLPPRRQGLVTCSAVALAMCLGVAAAEAQVAPGPGVNPRAVWSVPPEPFSMRVMADGFADPWEVTWGPDQQLWITERTAGRVLRVDPDTGTRTVALVVDDVSQMLAQDGLLGLALHPQFLAGRNHVFIMYTYDADPGPGFERRGKIRRYTFNPAAGRLEDPVDILTGIPHGPDHGGSRMAFGPDGKLYASTGDQGANFLAYICSRIRAQDLPTAAAVAAGDLDTYQGKILRLNEDGSIPADNPMLAGARSHIFSYGHRNVQGLAFAPDGRLYAAEHGQDTDDEVNGIVAGGNYGWPLIAGFADDRYYRYAAWADSAPTPCAELSYERVAPASVPRTIETEVSLPDFVPPLMSFFAVPADFDPAVSGNGTAALTGLDVYGSDGIPGWNPSVLVASMVSGTIYRIPLDPVPAQPLTYFRTQNRYRDIAISPDGRRIFAVTTPSGRTLTLDGELRSELANPGALLEFTYTGD